MHTSPCHLTEESPLLSQGCQEPSEVWKTLTVAGQQLDCRERPHRQLSFVKSSKVSPGDAQLSGTAHHRCSVSQGMILERYICSLDKIYRTQEIEEENKNNLEVRDLKIITIVVQVCILSIISFSTLALQTETNDTQINQNFQETRDESLCFVSVCQFLKWSLAVLPRLSSDSWLKHLSASTTEQQGPKHHLGLSEK